MTSVSAPPSSTRRQFVGVVAALAVGSLGVRVARAFEGGASLGTVTVGDVAFALPQGWYVDASQTTSDRALIGVYDPFSQTEIAQVALASADPSSDYDGLDPDALFAQLALECTPEEGASWGQERHDVGGFVLAATCSLAAAEGGELRAGRLYTGSVLGIRWYVMGVLARPGSVDAVLAQADELWSGAGWGAVIQNARESFEQGMLEDAVRRYAQDPWYNPYWTVSDFSCTMNLTNPETPYPDHMRMQYSTPEGIVAWDNEIERRQAQSLWNATTVELWCMARVDSDGAPYLRSTVAIGSNNTVADIAFYEGFSDLWYVAATGYPVCPGGDGSWYFCADETAESPWTPHFL